MEFSQDVAQALFFEGGACFCFNLPCGSEFGIDMKSFVTGEKFCGLKMIPPGVHFIYYSIENSHGDQSPKIGFFHNFVKKEVIVKNWDPENEFLTDEKDELKIERLKENLKSMDAHLGPYPYEIFNKWRSLSNNITKELLDKMIPLSGRIHSALELKASPPKPSVKNAETAPSKRLKTKLFFCDERNDDLLPKLEAVEGTEIRFSKIPDKCYPDNSTPSEITKHNLDSSYLFKQILSQHTNSNDILGELQLAFICFLIGCNFEAFEHWKKLVGIFCSCDEAICENSEIFSNFITVLSCQLQEIQEDFLVDIVEGNNFVYRNLRIFFRNLQSSDVNGRLKAKGSRFQQLLTEKWLWDFTDIFKDEEEYLPVVVDL